MIDTVKKESLKEFLLRTLADPVLIYAVIAIMSIMNHYRSSLTIAYGIAAYIAGWAVFRLFDYVNRHHFIGAVAYIALFAAFITGARMAVVKGGENYPISWGLWFLTPQDALQYNKWYTLAMFLLFLIFMMSVIYYFTRVRYRLFMNFLILIIPFSVYGKENEEMEIGFIIALCVGFFVVLANFRQLSDSKEAKAVNKREMRWSAVVFTVLFAIVASLVPKPHIEADRTIIETLIDADALTDRFLAMLNMFREDSGGEQFRGNLGNIPLYYAVSPTPLRLKTSTFTSYDYETDKWKYSDIDSRYWYKEEVPFEMYCGGGVAEAVIFAASNDGDFAEKYGLSDVSGKGITPVGARKMSIYSVSNSGTSAPVPMGAVEFSETSFEGTLGLTKAGTVFADKENFGAQEQFSFSFVPQGFFSFENNKAAADKIASVEDYGQLLEDTRYCLGNIGMRFETDDPLADTLKKYRALIDENSGFYEAAVEELLDYGENKRIYDLAQQLTKGLESPYEKAKALEYYFIENDYNYDLDYRKAAGENAEDFLFDTKRGVCYEYATAMTLLARAAGIPARYCEGFNMQTKNGDENSESYIITAQDAHGFPELYIKGYGWMSFEPTMTNDIIQEKKSVTSLLSRSGLIILIVSVLVLGLILLLPLLVHFFFLFSVRHKAPNDAVSAVIRRICRVYGISCTSSVNEAANAVSERSGADISTAAELFEMAEYGGCKLSENDKTKAIEIYVSACSALKEAKKAERKERRIRFKTAK